MQKKATVSPQLTDKPENINNNCGVTIIIIL